MALITVSVSTTIIDTLVDTDAEIQTAVRAFGNIGAIDGLSIIPISNTQAKLIMVWRGD